MFAVEAYINANYPDHLFSEMLYQQSTVIGAVSTAKREYGNFGAKAILISSLIISIPDDVGAATGVFTDVSGRILFTCDIIQNMSGIYEFWKVIDGPQLFISCSNPTVKFSLAHQYLTKKEMQR